MRSTRATVLRSSIRPNAVEELPELLCPAHLVDEALVGHAARLRFGSSFRSGSRSDLVSISAIS
jgi:hypothetical protein